MAPHSLKKKKAQILGVSIMASTMALLELFGLIFPFLPHVFPVTSNNFQLSEWTSSFLAPWPWKVVLLPGNPSHALHLNISSISQVGIACSESFIATTFPGEKVAAGRGATLQVNWRPGEGAEHAQTTLCVLVEGGPPSIHCPTQKGSNSQCQASLF